MKKVTGLAVLMLLLGNSTQAAEYTIDGTGEGMHSFVQWRASHIGISNLWGRFNDIRGTFTYDADDIESSSIQVTIGTASLDSNHRDRDIHLTSSDYVDAAKYPEATFVSTSVVSTGPDTVHVTGDLSFRDITRELSFEARRTGEGQTPFGDYRVGFEAETEIDVAEFGISNLMPSEVGLILSIEGIRQ